MPFVNQPVVAFNLPAGNSVWAGDSLPTSASDGAFDAGDFFWNTSFSAGIATLYKCTTGTTGPGGSAPVWQAIAGGGNAVKQVAAAYSATTQDEFIVLTANAQVTIPAASTALTGKTYVIKRNGAGNGTVVCAGSSPTLEAGTTATFGANLACLTIKCDGVQWWATSTYSTVNFS